MQLLVKMQKKSKNNVFRSKQKTSKVGPNKIRSFKVRKKPRLIF